MGQQLEDIKKECSDCKLEFLFTAGEQKYYLEHELVPTKRCADCRYKKRQEKENKRNQAFDINAQP